MKTLPLLLTLLFTVAVFAQDRPVQRFGDVQVHYTAFKSEFLEPSIAEAYGITRAEDQGVVNVSVVDDDTPYGKEAEVSGTARNLMNQRKGLEFVEVRDGEAVYYIATFDFENEEMLTFTIDVNTAGAAEPDTIEFQRMFRH